MYFNICYIFPFAASYCDASWVYKRLSGVQYMSEEDPSRLEVGESISFSCERGYRLRGASSVKCLPTGDLEGTGLLTQCESKYIYFSKRKIISYYNYNAVKWLHNYVNAFQKQRDCIICNPFWFIFIMKMCNHKLQNMKLNSKKIQISPFTIALAKIFLR